MYLPYYLMRYEKRFASWEKSDIKIKALQEDNKGMLFQT